MIKTKTRLVLFFLAFLLSSCSSVFKWGNHSDGEEIYEQPPIEEITPTSKPHLENNSLSASKQLSSKPHAPALADPSQPPQLIVDGSPQLKGNDEFDQAYQAQMQAEFQKSIQLWKEFLTHYPTHPLNKLATYNMALCFFGTADYKQALDTLEPLLPETELGGFSVDIRLLYAEALIEEGRLQESLSISFEVFPDYNAQKIMGLSRVKSAYVASWVSAPQKIRTFLLRARNYLGLFRLDLAFAALNEAEKTLTDQKLTIEKRDFIRLVSFLGWRKLQYLALSCSEKNPFPKSLSEEAFLTYVHHYYACLEEAKHVFCTIHTYRPEAIEPLALFTLKEMVLLPLKLKSDLPPPEKNRKSKIQKQVFEKEMKDFIDSKVNEMAKPFRFIDECDAENLF